jgi:hypothetical protein
MYIIYYTYAVCQLNCCWFSPAQSFLASGLVTLCDPDFCSVLDMCMFQKWGVLFNEDGDGVSM